jgi:hypothetical protein
VANKSKNFYASCIISVLWKRYRNVDVTESGVTDNLLGNGLRKPIRSVEVEKESLQISSIMYHLQLSFFSVATPAILA